MSKSDKVLQATGLLLNLGYLVLMGIWFSRNPENLTTPNAYSFFMAPILSFWCIRRRPLEIAAFIVGIPANFLNLAFLFVAFVGYGFSGPHPDEILLMFLFTAGNAILMVLSWIGARGRSSKPGPVVRPKVTV